MIQTVIADDEIWICKLIKNMIDWEQLGYSIIAYANDGITLCDIIEKTTPDLVITDIRMPGADGLSVIAHTKKLGLKTKFVIISGYSDFEYAKTAIKHGVLGYLLKPIEQDELSELLVSIKNELLSNDEVNEHELQTQLLINRKQHFEFYIQSLLQDRLTGEMAEMANEDFINDYFNRNFLADCYNVVLIRLDCRNNQCQDYKSDVLVGIADLSGSLFSNVCHDMIVLNQFDSIILVLNFKQSAFDLISSLLRDILSESQQSIAHIMRFDITIGTGLIVHSINQLARSYEIACKAIRSRLHKGKNMIINLEIHNADQDLIEIKLSESCEKMLTSYVSELSGISFKQFIIEFYKHCMSDQFTAYDLSNLLILRTVNSIPKRIQVLWTERYPGNNVQQTLDSCSSIDEIINKTADLLNEISELMLESGVNANRSIELIKNYVDENFSEDIKLEDVAEHVYLNANYISDLFKRETGIKFSKYLMSKRMEEAKKLLMDPRSKVNEVSAMVGYQDTKYFSRLFQEYVGVSPAKYKKMFS
jgi:two-component system response regulator YesN